MARYTTKIFEVGTFVHPNGEITDKNGVPVEGSRVTHPHLERLTEEAIQSITDRRHKAMMSSRAFKDVDF